MRRLPSRLDALLYTLIILVLGAQLTNAQMAELKLNNASFEGLPHRGTNEFGFGIRGWVDCGKLNFPRETPPDLHPINAWQVTKKPSEGMTYLGMVVRDVDSWEAVSQRLITPLEGDQCYSFSIDLSRSEKYISGSRASQRMENYTEPAVLRIWGGTGVCGKQVLLGESVTVSNTEWRTYEFEFRPERDVSYIMFEAFYKVPTLIPYNGHLLLDNATIIKEIPCDPDAPVEKEADIAQVAPKKNQPRPPAKTTPTPVSEPLDEVVVVDPVPVEEESAPRKIIPELLGSNFRKNQIIRISAIYFDEDSTRIKESSLDALDQVFEFMERNPSLVIEIGGHTSTGPPNSYCDQLSADRAWSVANYLRHKGISAKRLRYKGYGKRMPVIPNDRNNSAAKRKNQRVEIKILKTDFRI